MIDGELDEEIEEQQCEAYTNVIKKLDNNTLEHSFLPIENNQYLTAAEKAWVFGGMGSWNDMADLGDLDNAEYDRLSLELYREIMYAITFSVNEF